jgi:hypothetical protein
VIIRAIQRCLLSPLHTEKAVLHTAACNVLRGTYGKDLTLLKDQVHASDELLTGEQSTELPSSSVDQSQQVREPQSRQEQQDSSGGVTINDSLRDSAEPVEEPPHSGDLSYLIFENKNLTEVVQVMQHIAVEALKVKQDAPNLVKVVSDIDDTLFPGYTSYMQLAAYCVASTNELFLSFALGFRWLDRRYPLHIPYPGVSDLFARISCGLPYHETRVEKLPPSITFLTARPRGWLSVGRYMTVQHLKSLGVPNATVLNGSVKGLVSSKKIAR